jgi:hypothetical protein
MSGTASILFSSYLGGSNTITEGHGIAVDPAGNAYVTGYTYGNLPTTPGAFQTTFAFKGQHPSPEAFVSKIGVQSTPGAAPASSPAGGAIPSIAFAPAPTWLSNAPSPGVVSTDFAGVLPLALQPATLFVANSHLLDADSPKAPTLESGSPANAAISPIFRGDKDSGQRLNMFVALLDAEQTDSPAEWLVGPVDTDVGAK